MSQADRIGQYVLRHYVKQARAARRTTLAVRAGDMGRGMGLSGRLPNVGSALGSQRFLELARLQLRNRGGPPQITTTTFHYAIDDPGRTVPAPSSRPARPPSPSRRRTHSSATPGPPRGGDGSMTIVIQCAARKDPSAGHPIRESWRRVLFVADPTSAPRNRSISYQRPDDDSAPKGRSWRETLVEYNRDPTHNPLGLLQAWRLNAHPAYSELVGAFGLRNVFILSVGWGLLAADFLTPNYDITFSSGAASYKRRRPRDRYGDFSMVPKGAAAPIVFIGGKDYVPLFCSLTRNVDAERIVFYNSQTPPKAPDCTLRRFETRTRTNWHYECAGALIRGDVEIEAP